ncbi:hypothetical protein ACHAQE_000683 [Botrytis cinerea]
MRWMLIARNIHQGKWTLVEVRPIPVEFIVQQISIFLLKCPNADFIFDDSLNISSRKARTLTFLTDLRKDMAAAAPNRFNPGGFRGVRKPPTAEEWEKFSDYEKDEKRGEEWMNRVCGWNINAENEKVSSDRWLPDKLLGKGVAVFKKGHTTDTGDVFYKRIVVKQASSPEAKSRLQNGASILDHLRAYWVTDADHLVLPFGAYEEDAGTGTDDTFDPVYFHESTSDAVGRTYTSYCEGGNFHQWLENNFGQVF